MANDWKTGLPNSDFQDSNTGKSDGSGAFNESRQQAGEDWKLRIPRGDNGNVDGVSSAMPDRGTHTGMNPNMFLDGRSLEPNATNRLGSAHTSPDPADDRTPGDEGTPGDRD